MEETTLTELLERHRQIVAGGIPVPPDMRRQDAVNRACYDTLKKILEAVGGDTSGLPDIAPLPAVLPPLGSKPGVYPVWNSEAGRWQEEGETEP